MTNLPTISKLSNEFALRCDRLNFGSPVTHVYNPLVYAAAPHAEYIQRYGQNRKKVLFLGINPGPWGMAQSGIPFGDVHSVKNWIGIEGEVSAPAQLHPKRPVHGFLCKRREVSGQRLWKLFSDRFATPKNFFKTHMVMNYCPLLFSHIKENKCVNITPDKLSACDREKIYTLCDAFLRDIVTMHLQPEHLVGIGNFAAARLRIIFPNAHITRILHPSPASPAANRGFAMAATQSLEQAGIW